jgi:alcohol dehydrogenase
MKTWKLQEIGRPLALVHSPEPELRSGGVAIDVMAAHVPAYTGVLIGGARGSLPTPLTLGVAAIGRVTDVAADVFAVARGDIVLDTGFLRTGDVFDPEEVLIGWTGIGGRGVATDRTQAMRALWRDGVFAERAVCAKETVFRLPGAEAVEPSRLAVLPWLTIAAEALERAQLAAGQTVVVMGATGQLGAAAVLLALAKGAGRVIAVGRNEAVLAQLSEQDPRVRTGALAGDRAATAAAIREVGGEADVVIDALGAVPTPEPTLAALDSLRTDGTMVLVGGVRQDLAIPYGDFMHRRLTLRGSWMATPSTVAAVWNLVRTGVLDLDRFHIIPVPLDDVDAALELAADASGLDYVVVVP